MSNHPSHVTNASQPICWTLPYAATCWCASYIFLLEFTQCWHNKRFQFSSSIYIYHSYYITILIVVFPFIQDIPHSNCVIILSFDFSRAISDFRIYIINIDPHEMYNDVILYCNIFSWKMKLFISKELLVWD